MFPSVSTEFEYVYQPFTNVDGVKMRVGTETVTEPAIDQFGAGVSPDWAKLYPLINWSSIMLYGMVELPLCTLRSVF